MNVAKMIVFSGIWQKIGLGPLGVKKGNHVKTICRASCTVLWKKMGEKWKSLRSDGKMLENEGRI